MDYLNTIFNKKRPFAPIKISGGTTNGRISTVSHNVCAQQCLEASEMEMLEDDLQNIRQKMDDDIKSTIRTNDYIDDQDDDVYKKYKFDRKSQISTQLPIHQSKDKILSKIMQNPSVVIEGSTGCGKSTQIPQMILDDAKEHHRLCNIIVTQPRRIAARSIAERVAEERGWQLGTLVGYQIGLDKRFVSEDTRILFCTTGVLLEKLIQVKSLSQFTHIILDEVHERDKDLDFLLIIIRILWVKNATNVKIILMSATFDTIKFAEYFRFYQFNHWMPAPIIKVDKRNIYTVKEFYLDDFERLAVPEINWKQPGISDEMYKVALLIIQKMKHFDNECEINSSSILVFLPGIYEIGRFRNILMEYAESKREISWKILILHSLISTEDQQLIFQQVENGVRKIILSTNIAESSITVPDVKYVVDFCLMKYLKCDSSKNFTSLEMDWAAKNNCKQRTGRAGRVANGRCYRLVQRKFYECYMKESATPELLLAPLENLVLKAKTFEMGAPHIILGLALDRPKVEDVANTVLTLKELGALNLTLDEVYSPIDGDLTFLGRVMSNLPIDIRSTRLIMIGYCFGVLEECIIMAAGLTSKSIFKITFEKDLNEYTRRLEWSNGSGSDLFAILNAYKIWTLKHNQREFGKRQEQQRQQKEFCKRHYLDVRSLSECHQLVQELTRRLDKLGIREATGVNGIRWTEQEKSIILKVVIAGAFYPNFFTTASINPMMERNAFRDLNGRDPENTVFFTGFRQEHIRQLYVDSIRNIFRNTVVDEEHLDGVKITFDGNSEKVFVTFENCQSISGDVRSDWDTKHCSIPGKTSTEVYKAVKMRKMNMPTRIKVMKPEEERLVAEEFGIGIINGSSFTIKKNLRDDIRNMCIPNATIKEIIGNISYVENCSKFWFQPKSERRRLEFFSQELNQHNTNIIEPCTDYTVITQIKSTNIVARDHTDRKLYRARLISWDYDNIKGIFSGTVCFIDTGRKQKCRLNDLYVFTQQIEQAKIPPRCFQCKLAEIQPSMYNLSGGNMWDRGAFELFNSFIFDREVKAQIYSIVNGIVNVFIFVNGLNLNKILINDSFGEFCEENFLSKNNHWKRQHLQNMIAVDGQDAEPYEFADCEEYYPIDDIEPIKSLDEHICDRFVQLKGPRSPLESQVYSVLLPADGCAEISVNIDAHSVNGVLLSSMQQDLSIKYIVASHVSQQGSSNKEFTIHETTLLPNIRGFGALMAMIFSPAIDLKRDQWKTRYISLRAGLGYYDDKEMSYFLEHDIVIPMDFEFNEEDLSLINQMRYNMDTIFFAFNNKNRNDTVSSENKNEVMKKLKEITLKLLTKQRKAMETYSIKHEWKEYEPSEFKDSYDMYGTKSIFPLHGLPCLTMSMDNETKRRLKQHCSELRKMTMSLPRTIICQLCTTEIINVELLRTHLMTRLHLEREKEIGFDNLS